MSAQGLAASPGGREEENIIEVVKKTFDGFPGASFKILIGRFYRFQVICS